MHSALVKSPAAPVRVRAAHRGDLDALIALEEQVFVSNRLSRQSLRRLLRSPSAEVIVAEDQNDILAGTAILLFRVRCPSARLYSIAVVPPMNGQGIGARLLLAAEEVALGRGCQSIRLEVHETNHTAMARYRKSGYREFGRHDKYYEDGGDALRFEKRLAVAGEAISGETALLARARHAGR